MKYAKRGRKPSIKSFSQPVVFRVSQRQFCKLKHLSTLLEPDLAEYIRSCLFHNLYSKFKNEIPTKKEQAKGPYSKRLSVKLKKNQLIKLQNLAKLHTDGDISKYIRWRLFDAGAITVGQKRRPIKRKKA